MEPALENRKNYRQDKETRSGILRNLSEHITLAGTKQSIGCRTTEGDSGPSFFFRELNQHQEH